MAAMLVSGMALAQIPAGSIYAGASAGFYSNNQKTESSNGGTVTSFDDPYKYSSWNISMGPQYFVAENLSVGLTLGRNGYTSTQKSVSGSTTNTSENKSSGGDLGLSLTKYFNLTENLYFTAGLGFNIGSGKGTNTQTSTTGSVSNSVKSESENKSMNAGLNFGLAYHISDKIMLMGYVGALTYNSSSNKYNIEANGDYDQYSNSGIDFGLTTLASAWQFGFAYKLK